MLYLQLLDTSLMGGALAWRHGGNSAGCHACNEQNMAEIESEPVTMAEGSTSEEEESDHSSSYLSLHCSSSPFEGDGSASDVGTDDSSDGEDDSQRGVVPYLYEPEQENGSEPESEAS